MESSLVELGNRLATYRRAAKPADYGIVALGARRTPGLRREEVAELTGFSLDLISKVERGKYPSVSARLLGHLSDFYKLDTAQRRDLFNLARLEERTGEVVVERVVSPALQDLLDHQREFPTYVTNRRWDLVAWNEIFALVMGDPASLPDARRNILWILFGTPGVKTLIVDWERHARRVIGQFRLDYGWARNDERFVALVQELTQVSPEFAEWWASGLEVSTRTSIFKQVNHPLLGLLDFQQIGFRPEENPNLLSTVYYPTDPRTADLLRRFLAEHKRTLALSTADFSALPELVHVQGD